MRGPEPTNSSTPLLPSDLVAKDFGTIDSERNLLEVELTRGMMPLARNWRHALDHQLMGLGLSSATGWALLLIDELGDEVRQTDLAGALDINSASLVRVVDMLVAVGYVDRRFDAIDRRVRRVRLLAKGREATRKVAAAVAALRKETLANLDDADLAIAVRVARGIGRSLEEGRRP